jgi:hypothetical protein
VNITDFSDSSIPRRDSSDPNTLNPGYLTVPQGLRQRHSVEHNVNHPLLQFWAGDAPWSTHRLRASHPPPQSDYSYSDPTGSEIDALAPRSDSGYVSALAPRSIVSHDPENPDQELSPGVAYGIRNMGIGSVSSEPGDLGATAASAHTDQASVYSGRSGRSGTVSTGPRREHRCPECHDVFRNRSDLKCVSFSSVIVPY